MHILEYILTMSDNGKNQQPKRRKNLIFDADYIPKEVHATTRWRWQKNLKQFKGNFTGGKYIMKTSILGMSH